MSRNRTSLPFRRMLHVLLSRHQRRHHGRKCAAMSSSPSVARIATISSSLWSPSGSAKLMFTFSCHQQLRSLGALPERFDNPFYRRGVVWGEVTSHNVPSPRACRQLKPNDVGSELLYRLHREVRRRPVKYFDAVAVSAWCVCHNDAIPSQPAGVDTIRQFLS